MPPHFPERPAPPKAAESSQTVNGQRGSLEAVCNKQHASNKAVECFTSPWLGSIEKIGMNLPAYMKWWIFFYNGFHVGVNTPFFPWILWAKNHLSFQNMYVILCCKLRTIVSWPQLPTAFVTHNLGPIPQLEAQRTDNTFFFHRRKSLNETHGFSTCPTGFQLRGGHLSVISTGYNNWTCRGYSPSYQFIKPMYRGYNPIYNWYTGPRCRKPIMQARKSLVRFWLLGLSWNQLKKTLTLVELESMSLFCFFFSMLSPTSSTNCKFGQANVWCSCPWFCFRKV